MDYIAHQAPLSMGFPRQEYWSGSSHPSQGIFPTQGWNPHLLLGRWILYHWTSRGAPYRTRVGCKSKACVLLRLEEGTQRLIQRRSSLEDQSSVSTLNKTQRYQTLEEARDTKDVQRPSKAKRGVGWFLPQRLQKEPNYWHPDFILWPPEPLKKDFCYFKIPRLQ